MSTRNRGSTDLAVLLGATFAVCWVFGMVALVGVQFLVGVPSRVEDAHDFWLNWAIPDVLLPATLVAVPLGLAVGVVLVRRLRRLRGAP
jgi:hypothetical protein